jgi:hypothetical protein
MHNSSNKSKGYMPVSSGPNMTGFDMGKTSSLMEMMQTGGPTTRGGAALARALQMRSDQDRLDEIQRAEAKRQKRGGLFGSIGGLAGGLLGAALAPVTGGASLALAAGLGTALGKRAGEGLGAGKSRSVDRTGTVFGQQSFRDVEQASRDYTRGMGERALLSGLQAAATAGLSPGGGMYGKVGGKLATSQARQALKEAIPMAIKQAPSSLMSVFQGAPTPSLPVAPDVERITSLSDIAGDLAGPSSGAKIFDPSAIFSASSYDPFAIGPLLESGSFFSDMEDGGLIGMQTGGLTAEEILEQQGLTATPEQLALFQSFDPTSISRATQGAGQSLLGMTGGQGLASAGGGFGAQQSAISQMVEQGQKSLEQQIQDEQKAFESQTLGTAADIVAGDGEFGKVASTPTFDNINDVDLGTYRGDTIVVGGVTMVWTPFGGSIPGGIYQPQS